MFEFDGDTYDFDTMTVSMMRGFRFYKHNLHAINDTIFRSQFAHSAGVHKEHDMIKLQCPPEVQYAYQEYLAEKELLEL